MPAHHARRGAGAGDAAARRRRHAAADDATAAVRAARTAAVRRLPGDADVPPRREQRAVRRLWRRQLCRAGERPYPLSRRCAPRPPACAGELIRAD